MKLNTKNFKGGDTKFKPRFERSDATKTWSWKRFIVVSFISIFCLVTPGTNVPGAIIVKRIGVFDMVWPQ